jgi:hypothetical protein
LSNEEFAAALELGMAAEVDPLSRYSDRERGRHRGAVGMMATAQRLERIADEAPAPQRRTLRGIAGRVRQAIFAAFERGLR